MLKNPAGRGDGPDEFPVLAQRAASEDPRWTRAVGEEAVLADSGRVGEVVARVGRVRSLELLSILLED